MDLSSNQKDAMPSKAAERLCRSLSSLMDSPTTESRKLSPTVYQQILHYCGVRPNLMGWRSFLTAFLTLLGLLALVAGAVFFIAWNWAAMPKMAKFALAQLLIIALAVVVWWRWYDAVARMALLAVGLSFGGLFALYGQVYQTGADSWELFRAWAGVLLPLALLGRQNALWFCTWVIANLAFQLYYLSRVWLLFDDIMPSFLSWLPNVILYGYLAVQIALLLVREALAEYTAKNHPSSWLASRWFSRVMAAYLLLTLTLLVVDSLWSRAFFSGTPLIVWGAVLATGYGYYRYRRPDLCMLTLGVISLMVVGCVLIIQLLGNSWSLDSLFIMGLLMAILLAAGSALLLHWRRTMSHSQATGLAASEETDLLQALRQHQLLNDAQVAEIAAFDHATDLPWYLRVALAVGGWVAALITLLLLALLLYTTNLLDSFNGISLILPSLVIAALAAIMLRAEGVGKHHIGLAWAIAATYGLCIGVYLLLESSWRGEVIIDALWYLPVIALMAVAMPDRLYRFMAVTTLVFLLIPSFAALVSSSLPYKLALGLTVLLVAGIVVLWLWLLTRQERPRTAAHQELRLALLYGIPAGLALQCLANVQSDILYGIFWANSLYSPLPLLLGVGIAVGFITGALIHAGRFRAATTAVYLPAAIVCGGIAIFAPGIGLGLALLLVARYQGSQVLLATAGCFLMLYLIYWYYFLGVTLLHKSLLLLASGLLLLGLAWAAKKLLPGATGETYAN
ncbi:DUF4401 domain-containing protein [Yersinia rohdei]|uniref:DUF4401 domain-containing protein n=1 Tax=Yersinia rohdei TaxID=29485 RepID=UPI0011A88061|nr:DUF4401 domain-containing protein [Yersinia rohdei]